MPGNFIIIWNFVSLIFSYFFDRLYKILVHDITTRSFNMFIISLTCKVDVNISLLITFEIHIIKKIKFILNFLYDLIKLYRIIYCTLRAYHKPLLRTLYFHGLLKVAHVLHISQTALQKTSFSFIEREYTIWFILVLC